MSYTETITPSQINTDDIELAVIHTHHTSETKPSPTPPNESQPPDDAQSEVERWNYPRSNVPKITFAFLAFMIAGMNDAAIGVSLINLVSLHYYRMLTIQ